MKILLIIPTIFIISCAHHKDVRPSSDGNHQVIFQTEDNNSGYRTAKSQADHFCEKQNKIAYITKEGSQYNGSMNESDYKTTKTVSRVAKTLGGTVWALGGKKESNAGGIVGLGGGVADSIAGEGYKYQMTFNCK